jgi:hypothetical protein
MQTLEQKPARRRTHLVRETVAFAVLASACCVASRRAPASAVAARQQIVAEAPATTSSAQAAAFASLEARAPLVAPGMKIVAQKESTGERVELVRAQGRDVCARVVFQADAPVVAKLVDGHGAPIASSTAPASEGVLGEKGPVCIRRGDTLSAASDGNARVRWVAWGSW